MTMYLSKCSCGQPYNVRGDGDYPMKDKFTTNCPSCKNQLTHKSSSMDVTWVFDPTFNKEA